MAETDQHAPVRAGTPRAGAAPAGAAPAGTPRAGAAPAGTPRAGTPRVAPSPSPIGRAARRPRTAHLALRRVEPWSVVKLLLVLALVAVVMALVAVTALYALLDAMGVFDTVGTFTSDIGATHSRQLITLPALLGWTGAITAVLALTGVALGTIGCYVYNLAGNLVGGPEITFGERG